MNKGQQRAKMHELSEGKVADFAQEDKQRFAENQHELEDEFAKAEKEKQDLQ